MIRLPSSEFPPTRPQGLRLGLDRAVAALVALGGIGVLVAILLIFLFLLAAVLPLFQGASLGPGRDYPAPGGGEPLYLALEPHAGTGVRIAADGGVHLFALVDGHSLGHHPLPEGAPLTAFAAAPGGEWFAFGRADGRLLPARLRHPGGMGGEPPVLEFPYGGAGLPLSERPLELLALRREGEGLQVAALEREGGMLLARLDPDGPAAVQPLPRPAVAPRRLLLGDGRLYAAGLGGHLYHYDLRDPASPRLEGETDLVAGNGRLLALLPLAGGRSLVAGDSEGMIRRWLPLRGADGGVRMVAGDGFGPFDAPVAALAAEVWRKGFLSADGEGWIGVHHATSGRELLRERIAPGPLVALAVAPHGDALLAEARGGRLHYLALANPHPEVSWSALWRPLQYEDYPEPDYVWQSSAGSAGEPKLSLVPLSFGTLKAAFYALLLAVPLAVLGALYTAHFMDPRMRARVKPTIEIMEALPTVILGFLAGLWLAPAVEGNLVGVVLLVVAMPLGSLAAAWAWQRGPLHGRLAGGWEAALLVPVILLLGGLCLALGAPLEQLLFAGDLRGWLSRELGIDYHQRNAVVVGLAMGFAVIPTIFSIAEDAVYGVPPHLGIGSAALGATRWQTLRRVVLVTASPGIFSAVMIGFGRAVGETMIVLMATGNTPLLDPGAFTGMRTLAANIAVEMPESEVGSSHYRVLFLSGLVLFLFTFLINTLAERVRQRLRRRYALL